MAHLKVLRPFKELAVSGSMGMRGARPSRRSSVTSPDDLRAGYDAGGVEVLERLKAYAER